MDCAARRDHRDRSSITRGTESCCRVVGVLAPNPKVFAALSLEEDLAALGWRSERNLRLLLRWGAGSNDELPALAAELVAQKVDLIFAAGDQATIAAQRASTKIPIVGVCDDMVGSHRRADGAPRRQHHGDQLFLPAGGRKAAAVLHELVPQARIGVLADPTTISTGRSSKRPRRPTGIELIAVLAANPDEIGTALDHLAAANVGAVSIRIPDPRRRARALSSGESSPPRRSISGRNRPN